MAEHEQCRANNAGSVVHNASKQYLDGQFSTLEYTFKINSGWEA